MQDTDDAHLIYDPALWISHCFFGLFGQSQHLAFFVSDQQLTISIEVKYIYYTTANRDNYFY